jgi:hypothetical protein
MAFFKFLGTLATIVATVLVVGFFLTMVPKGVPIASVTPAASHHAVDDLCPATDTTPFCQLMRER